jgi:sugar lactone lactonase YvrE
MDHNTQIENQKALIESYQDGLIHAQDPDSRQFLKTKLSQSILELTTLERGKRSSMGSPESNRYVSSPEFAYAPNPQRQSLDPGRTFLEEGGPRGDWTHFNQGFTKPKPKRHRYCTLRNFLILIFILIITTVGIVLGLHFGLNQGPRYSSNARVSVYSGTGIRQSIDGINGTSAFEDPLAMAIDINRNIYVAEPAGRIRRISSNLQTITLVGGINNPNIPNPNIPNPNIPNPNVPFPTTPTNPNFPNQFPNNLGSIGGMALDAGGNIVFCDTTNNLIKRVSFTGQVTIVAGSGQAGSNDGTLFQASFNQPTAVAFEFQTGNILVAETGGVIRRINFNTNSVNLVSNSGRTGEEGQSQVPNYSAMVSDLSGNVYAVDRNNHAIRRITAQGAVTTIAGGREGYADGQGRNAQFRQPTGIAIDRSGTIYVTDTGNHIIRRVTADGTVTSVAGNRQGYSDGVGNGAWFDTPTGIVVDGNTLYVADQRNQRIRRIDLL